MDYLNTVEKIREFNRFYTTVMSLLNKSYLNSDYAITEARILYELYENNGCNANYIVHKLHIDKSYLSRIIKKFENINLLERTVSKHDTRAYDIILTDKGIAETESLIKRSNANILDIINSLSASECKMLESSIDTITMLLSKKED